MSDTVTTRADSDGHETSTDQVTWLPVSEAADETGVSVGAVRKWARRGAIASRTAEGPRGERLEVSLADVAARAEVLDADRARDAPAAFPADSLPVPRDAWERVLSQLGHLHQAGQDLAEARERAARAETREQFMREQVEAAREEARRAREEAEALRAKVAQNGQAPAQATPARRRWWSRSDT